MRTINSGRLVRRFGIVVAIVIGALALAPRHAAAQFALADPISPEWLAARLARAGVAIPPERFVEAWLRYAEQYQSELLPACEARLASDPTEEGSPDNRYLGVARERRRQALDEQILAAEDRLRDAFFAELLQATARPEDRVVVEHCRDIESVVQARTRASCAMPSRESGPAWDIGEWLATQPLSDGERRDPAMFRARVALASSCAQERRAAFLKARALIFARCQEDARNIERARDERAVQPEAGDARASSPRGGSTTPALQEPLKNWLVSEEVRDQVLAGQRTACIAILDKLEPALRERLVDHWFSITADASKSPTSIVGMDVASGEDPIGPVVAELMLAPGLQESGKARLRTLGRAWIADDRRIRAESLEQWLQTGTIPDSMPRRNARALEARAAIGAIGGLEFFSQEWERFAVTGRALEDEEWCAGFVRRRRQEIEFAQSLPKQYMREPVGYSPQDQALLADLMGLDDRRRALFAEMFEHARRRWENEVEPVVAEMRPGRRMRDAGMEEIDRAYTAAREAATAIDREIADSVAAVLDVPDAGPVLEWYRVARLATLGPGRAGVALPVVAVLLQGPLSVDGRRTAILNASAAFADFRAAEEASTAADRARREWIGAIRGGRIASEDYEARKQALEAQSAAAAAAYSQAQDALRSAIAGALRDRDAERWTGLSEWTAHPSDYADPAALWASVDRLVQCLDDAQRPLLQPQIAAIEARCTEMLRNLGDRTVAASRRLPHKTWELTQSRLRSGIESVASSPIVLLVPERCAPKPPIPSAYFRLGPALARLRANCDDAATAPPVRAP